MHTYIKITAEENSIGGTTTNYKLMHLSSNNNIFALTFDPA